MDLSASLKVWPFNSSIVLPNSSPSKNCKDGKKFVVRGLIAVALLAYRGGYTSVREVSLQVREVLELIVADIAAKILGGINRYRFHRILSQIAYLEDISSWVYSLQSLQVEDSNSWHIDQKQVMPDNQCIISLQSDKEVCLPDSETDSNDQEIVEASCSPLPETDNADPIVQSSRLVSEDEPLQAVVDSMPMLRLNSSIDCEPTAPEESCKLEDPVACPKTRCENADISKFETSCIYQCCSHCRHAIHTLTHKILMNCWKSRGCFSRVDDVHDILASCAARLLASTSACYACQSCNSIEEDTNKEHESCRRECLCQGFDDIMTSTFSLSKHLNKKILSTVECTCRPKATEIDVAVSEHACRHCKPTLKLAFRNNILVLSNSSEETNLHCNYNKLCLCSVVEGILASKHLVS